MDNADALALLATAATWYDTDGDELDAPPGYTWPLTALEAPRNAGHYDAPAKTLPRPRARLPPGRRGRTIWRFAGPPSPMRRAIF